MSPLFLLLLICFPLHACSARYLGLTDKKTTKQVFNKTNFQVLEQDVDKLNLHRTSVPSEMMPPVSEEQGAEGRHVVRNKDRSTRKSLLGATTMNNQKDVEAFMKQEEGTKGATSAGNKVIVSSQADLQQDSKIIKELKGQGRSMLGSTANDTEEALQSEENDFAGDVVVMDYAQPHRKPPIHNEKP